MHSFAKEMTHFIKTLKGLAFVIMPLGRLKKGIFTLISFTKPSRSYENLTGSYGARALKFL